MMYGSLASSKDLNLPFSPSGPFNHPKEEESDLHHQHNHRHMNSGLLRYRSAPSSFLGEVCEEAETMFSRLMSPDPRDEIREKSMAAAAGQRSRQFVMQHGGAEEVVASQNGGFSSASQMLYHSQLQNHSAAAVESSYRVVAMDSEQMKNSGNCSNLIRHCSSPAGLFSHLNGENGYAVMRGMDGFRNPNGSIGETGMAGSGLKGQISFSPRKVSPTGLMSQISEMESDSMGGSSPEESSLGSGNGGSGRCYLPGFPITSWDDSHLLSDDFSGLKRAREGDEKIIAGVKQSESQNGEVRNHVSSLTHQFSLPKTSSEMAAFLQFQDSVPCKIRAKRGCATHPRSIAERVRRTRISERMRKLQDLVPNMDKQTNTADMLDLAVEYIKDLQKHVKTISDNRSNCTCSSSKQKPYPNPAE